MTDEKESAWEEIGYKRLDTEAIFYENYYNKVLEFINKLNDLSTNNCNKDLYKNMYKELSATLLNKASKMRKDDYSYWVDKYKELAKYVDNILCK